MPNLRPDQLPNSTGLSDGDILIAETNPNQPSRESSSDSKI